MECHDSPVKGHRHLSEPAQPPQLIFEGSLYETRQADWAKTLVLTRPSTKLQLMECQLQLFTCFALCKEGARCHLYWAEGNAPAPPAL